MDFIAFTEIDYYERHVVKLDTVQELRISYDENNEPRHYWLHLRGRDFGYEINEETYNSIHNLLTIKLCCKHIVRPKKSLAR